MRKDLRHITIEKSVPDDEKSEEKNVLTVEGIRLKSTYSKQDTESLEHLDFAAGFPPNLRGIHSTMYVQKPWKTQKVKEFTINSLENMKAEINSFSVNETTVFKTVIDTILPIIAFYIIPTETKNVQTEKITGIVQNEILKEILTPELHRTSLKIITDILEFTGKKALFDSVCISGCAIQKAGASVDMELAYTLAHGFEIIRTGLSAGMKIDDIASRLSFSFGTGMNHFMEIAKMRAARMIWAKLIQQFNPKDSKSLHLQIHAQTTHHHINTENLLNTITRICIASATAAYGGTQSLQTGFSDTNDNFSGNISEKFIETTQSYFQNETKITKTVDPWGGSFYVESLTHEIVQKSWEIIQEIENFGGMTQAIEAGILTSQFKEKLSESIKTINPKTEPIRTKSDFQKVAFSLEKISSSSRNGKANWLELTIEAAKNGATSDEISTTLGLFPKNIN